jgi:nucleolar protein 12
MSLLGDIFGGADKVADKKSKKQKSRQSDEEPGLTGLFTESSELPERPKHAPRPKKEKRKDQENKDEESPKKRRKPRKEKPAEDSTTNEDSKNEDETPISKEDEVEARTIFVGNLPLKGTNRKTLAALFKDCGAIDSTRIRSVPVQGIKLPPESKGDQKLMKKVCVNTKLVDLEGSAKDSVQGYVVFKKEESVAKALELNYSLMVDGRRIRVDRASPSVEPSRSVFCGGLPYAADETTLQNHFIQGCDFDIGDIEGVRIIRDKDTFQCKGFGYVLLKEKSMVPTALKMHETVYMKKKMRVLVCGKRFKNKKGAQAPHPKRYSAPKEVKGTAAAPKEVVTVGAFRRMLGKQTKEATIFNKRKRGEKKNVPVKKGGSVGISKRAALDKKVDQKVKKLQKRATKGMGKNRH